MGDFGIGEEDFDNCVKVVWFIKIGVVEVEFIIFSVCGFW